MWLKLCTITVLFLGTSCNDFDYSFEYSDGSGTDEIKEHPIHGSSLARGLEEINRNESDNILARHVTDGDVALNESGQEKSDSFTNQGNERDEDITTTTTTTKILKHKSKMVHNLVGKNISVETNVSLEANNVSSEHEQTSTGNKTEPNVDKTKGEDKAFAINASTASNITSMITTTTTTITTTADTTTPLITTPVIINTSRATTKSTPVTTENTNDSNETASIFKAFNFQYFYFLLLLIPIGAVGIAVTFYCKRRKRKDDYIEPNPRATKNRRLSTPSWVFSEPDFDDEEVITLQEEKK